MWTSILGFVGSIFANQKASDTAIDIIRNVSGANDLTEKEKLDFVLEYAKNTKHQSVTRRNIAILTVAGMMVFSGTYLLVACFESFYVFWAIDSASVAAAAASENLAKIKTAPLNSLQNDLMLMMGELKEPFMIVFGFYFLSQTIVGARK